MSRSTIGTKNAPAPHDGSTARRLDGDHRREVSIGGEAGQVEDQFDDPTAGEDLAVLAGLVDLKHLRTRSFVQVEAHLAPQ